MEVVPKVVEVVLKVAEAVVDAMLNMVRDLFEGSGGCAEGGWRFLASFLKALLGTPQSGGLRHLWVYFCSYGERQSYNYAFNLTRKTLLSNRIDKTLGLASQSMSWDRPLRKHLSNTNITRLQTSIMLIYFMLTSHLSFHHFVH